MKEFWKEKKNHSIFVEVNNKLSTWNIAHFGYSELLWENRKEIEY